MVQPGFVKKLMPYGCFVEFPCGISGLAPLKFLTDEFISSPTGIYEESQTVWAKVREFGCDCSAFSGTVLCSLWCMCVIYTPYPHFSTITLVVDIKSSFLI